MNMHIVDYGDATPISWYALQHHMNIVNAWLSRKQYSMLTLQYCVAQYCDMFSDTKNDASLVGLARAVNSLYCTHNGKAPKDFSDISHWLKYCGYIALGPGLSFIKDDLERIIISAKGNENGPGREED